MQAGKDYYDLLGVARDADAASIKRAFRKLAKIHHPDKNPGDSTSEKLYVELNHAYEVLSDEGKRSKYDRFGEAGLKGGGGEEEEDGWGGFGDWGDIFGGGGGRRKRREEEKRSPSYVAPLTLSLELLYGGGIVELTHRRRVICANWGDCESKCTRCGGSGITVTTRKIGPGFVQQVRSHCPKCGGSGKIVSGNCTKCPEGQFEISEKAVMLDVEPGFKDGHHIVLEGASDELPDHTPGNVHFEIDMMPHPAFRREGDDLHYDLTITLTEALVGIDRAVRQLDDRVVRIKNEGVTVPKQELIVPGEGMPTSDGGAGNLVVHIWVEFPKSLTDEQKQAVFKLHGKVPKTEIGNGGGTYEPGSGNLTKESDEGVCGAGCKAEL